MRPRRFNIKRLVTFGQSLSGYESSVVVKAVTKKEREETSKKAPSKSPADSVKSPDVVHSAHERRMLRIPAGG